MQNISGNFMDSVDDTYFRTMACSHYIKSEKYKLLNWDF